MGILVGLERVAQEWPGKQVLREATIGIYEGERIGIVGRNGDGKSTLLQLIGHSLTPDSGTIVWRNNISVGMLAQTDDLRENDTVDHAIRGDIPDYEWASNPKIRSICDELLADVDMQSSIATLSGGQRRRVDLVRVLARDWDVLLMDEPTNHLDMHAIRWLAQHLVRRWPLGVGALLVVTHDRWFLDEVCEHMWEVHDGMIDPFEGGYSAYIQQRVERQRQEAVAEERRQNVLRKELYWLTHDPQARATKPKFRIKAAHALLAQDPPVRNTLELRRLAMSRLGKQVFELKHIGVSFGDQMVLKDITWAVGPGDRVGILGENGAGKSTLLRLMSGKLRPTTGFLKIGKTVQLAVMSQQLESLSEHNNERLGDLLSSFKQVNYINGKPQSPQQMAERLGFTRNDWPSFIKDLSGGERRRLAILSVLLQEPNVLILDEPGNDLDTDMLAVVEDVLDGWPGTLLLVTHDRYLMERVTDDQYAIIDGALRHCPGGVDEYLRLLDERKAAKLREVASLGSEASDGADGKLAASVSETALKSKLSNQARRAAKKRFDAVERRLEKLREETPSLQDSLSSHDPTDYQGLLEAQGALDAHMSEIDELENEWLELADALDEA